MCKYCEETKERAEIDNNGEIKIKINEQMGNNLEINYYYFGTKVCRYIQIVFCPMCGRLVNKEVMEEQDYKENLGNKSKVGKSMDNKNLKIYTNNIEQEAIEQIDLLLQQEPFKNCKVRIMPDVHAGKGCVIGFTADLGNKVIPNIVRG